MLLALLSFSMFMSTVWLFTVYGVLLVLALSVVIRLLVILVMLVMVFISVMVLCMLVLACMLLVYVFFVSGIGAGCYGVAGVCYCCGWLCSYGCRRRLRWCRVCSC